MLGPRRLARLGIENAVKVLQGTLTSVEQNAQKMWVWAGKDTATVTRTLQAWRRPTTAIINRAPKADAMSARYDIAIVIPRAKRATIEVALLLKTSKPACILVPTDLVHYIAQQPDGTTDKQLEAAVAKAKL